ncbi:MAG: M13 family metallopeptidase [Bacteroidales bacterium]|nr:M13 family metallopeptidase [Bacteroidales bacterium]
MKHWMILPMACLMLFGTGCKQSRQSLDLTNLDTSVDPKQDFYQYACGGWMEKNPLPGEYSRYGAFDQLRETSQNQLQTLITDLAANVDKETGTAKKIGMLYNMVMDSAKLNEQGMEPVRPLLESVQALDSKEAALGALAGLHHQGIMPFFYYFVGPDIENSEANMMLLDQGGLGMPDRDYYLEQDENNKKIRAAYVNMLEKMFVLYGSTPAEARAKAADVLALETRIAASHFSREECRVPKDNFNRMTVEDLQKLFPALDWTAYFAELSPNYTVKELSVDQLPMMKKLATIVDKATLEELKAYYEWNIIRASASYVGDEIYAQSFDFYGRTLSGKQEMSARWKRAVDFVDGVLGEGLGELYVARYFPPEAKARMIELIGNVKAAMNDRFDANTWMSDETKAKAKDKLASVLVKVGYPDKFRSYDDLKIEDDALFANVLRSNVFDCDYMMSKLGKPVDRNEWQMFPQTVNAYYNPTTNEICFPAGILQVPFFYMNGDDAINYGAIGVVIAHEMTHGFDDQGRQFDKNGNLNDWWTAEDAEKFSERAQRLIDHFDQIVVIDSLHANGRFTLGENIADNGGLNISFAALQKALQQHPEGEIDGFTPAQRFFLSYANVWAGNVRDEEIRRLTMIDPHSLGRWRVNGTLPHVAEFLEAFDIHEGDAMWLAPEKRAVIW